MRFLPSAFRHGKTRGEIVNVLADPLSLCFEIHDDEDGNNQIIAVGYTRNATLLEVGIKYVNDTEIIFHANRANKYWQHRFHRGDKSTWGN